MVTDIALSEFDDLIALADAADADAWSAPTRCEGWVVSDLCRHATSVAMQQGEAFFRAQLGITEKPSWLEVPQTGADLVAALRVGREHLAAGHATVAGRDDAVVPMPYADEPVPLFVAEAVLVLEYGTHASDLRAALGKGDELSDAAVGLLYPLLPALLDHLGQPPTDPDHAPVFGFGATTVGWNGSTWAPLERDPDLSVTGSDNAVTLFVLGRIPADDPRLTISGDPALFTTHFATL